LTVALRGRGGKWADKTRLFSQNEICADGCSNSNFGVTAQEASVSRPFLADSPTPRGQAGMPDLLFAASVHRESTWAVTFWDRLANWMRHSDHPRRSTGFSRKPCAAFRPNSITPSLQRCIRGLKPAWNFRLKAALWPKCSPG